MNKQQQLTFDKGITNIPSDALCDDNELEVSENIVYRDGEHQPIQDPVKILPLTEGQLLFVHKPYGSSDKYIVQDVQGYIYWVTKQESGEEEPLDENNLISKDFTHGQVKIEAIGNTLFVSDEQDSGFFKWSQDKYQDLGSTPPEPKVLFTELGEVALNQLVKDQIPENSAFVDWIHIGGTTGQDAQYENAGIIGQGLNWENVIVGTYSEMKNNMRYNGFFWAPFFARVAVQLYDGSYILHSAPILLLPSVRHNCYFAPADYHDASSEYKNIKKIAMFTPMRDIGLKADFDYTEWEDVVKGVSLFITDQIEINHTDRSSFPAYQESLKNQILADGIANLNGRSTYTAHKENGPYFQDGPIREQDVTVGWKWNIYHCRTFAEKTDKEITEDLEQQSIFYKVADLGKSRNDTEYHSFREFVTRVKFQNLTTQEQLPDDYYSHCKQIGADVDSYNNRLIFSGIRRTPYAGHKHFASISSDYKNTDVYVRTESENGDRIVKTQMWKNENVRFYFYYPDPNAKEVWAFVGDRCILHSKLKEHPLLNGAYYCSELPSYDCNNPASWDVVDRPQENASPIFLNQIMFSEVDNPFVFTARGVVGFGTGELLALTTTTQALSQGQFGQYPLLAFTTEGIWAVTIDSEGYPASSAPMSREVLVKGGPLVNTDGAVFFATKKGLMMIVGSDVRCVSEQLMGDFPQRLAASIIAYDYRDSLLWIVPKSGIGEEVTSYCYVYNMKTGTFHTSHYFFPTNSEQVNSYRDFKKITDINFFEGERLLSQGVESWDAIRSRLQQKWVNQVNVYDLSNTRSIVFDTLGRQFLEQRNIHYTIDGKYYNDTVVYYKSFDDIQAYLDASYFRDSNKVIYNKVDGALVPYIHTMDELIDSINTNRLFGRYEDYNIEELMNVLYAGMGVHDVSVISTGEVFVNTQKASTDQNYTDVYRFYLRCEVSFWLKTGGENHLSLYFSEWDGMGDYVNEEDDYHPFDDVVYVLPNNYGYKWNRTNFATFIVGFDGYVLDVDNVVANKSALEDDLATAGVTKYRIEEQGVVFSKDDLRFYQCVSVLVSQTYGMEVYETYYLENWDGDKRYVDGLNHGNPYEGIFYMQSDDSSASFVEWSDNDVIYWPILSVPVVDDIQGNIKDGAYNEEELKGELVAGLDGAPLADLDIRTVGIVFGDETINGRYSTEPDDDTIYYDITPYQRFVWEVDCSYYYRGEQKCRYFYTIFDDSINYRNPNNDDYPYSIADNVVYRKDNKAYYRWNGTYMELTFAGLSGVVNSYPDTLFQKLGDGIYSLMERPQPTDDENTYNGVIMTRPMKLENALALKSIMQLRNICQMDGTIVLSIWGSNDLRSWVKLRAFRNAPWKYYRFRFEFSNMPATDRFAGTVLITQERRTNKLR